MVAPDLPARIADWLEEGGNERPFFHDPAFIHAFGRPDPAMLRAAVDELWRRADIASYAASHPLALPSRQRESANLERIMR